jgi:hypothetical protein
MADGLLERKFDHSSFGVRETSKKMLDFEASCSRFLTPYLRETTENAGS